MVGLPRTLAPSRGASGARSALRELDLQVSPVASGWTRVLTIVTMYCRVERMNQGGVRALAKRLNGNELTQEDRDEIARVRQVLALRREGASILECARATGQTERRLQQYMKRTPYKLYADYIIRLERADDERQVGDVVKSTKQEFVRFGPDAIDFYHECFLRNPVEDQEKKGIFKDPARAEWATERVSRGLGLTEPDIAVRPTINIASPIIVGELTIISRDDARAKEDSIETTATVVSEG